MYLKCYISSSSLSVLVQGATTKTTAASWCIKQTKQTWSLMHGRASLSECYLRVPWPRRPSLLSLPTASLTAFFEGLHQSVKDLGSRGLTC